jgi:hypothetical protein
MNFERENSLIGFIMAIVIIGVAFSVAVVSLGVYEILRLTITGD